MSATAPPLPTDVVHQQLAIGSGGISLLRGGDGPPVLFLHGSGGAGLWLPFHHHLARKFTLLAADHPGFGASDDLPEIEDVHDLAFHYADVVATLGFDRLAVVGTSFGGWIAAELAAYRPDLVERLVLVAPIGLYIEGSPIADLFMMGPAEKAASLFHDPAVAAGLFPAEPDLEFILAMAREEAAFARFAWSPFCHDPRLARLLPRITAPTLVVGAEHDAVVPSAHVEQFTALIPGAELTVLPGTGHAIALERPAELAALITTFLD